MKALIGMIFGAWMLNFASGYVAVRWHHNDEKTRQGCQKLLAEIQKDPWLLPLVMVAANGEANACMDIGAFP